MTPPDDVSERKSAREAAWVAISDERLLQINKWGDRTIPGNGRTAPEWATILTEEVGELSEAALEAHFAGKSRFDIRAEAIQVAAVAVAIIEACDNDAIADRDQTP